jgi:hypothetical protein
MVEWEWNRIESRFGRTKEWRVEKPTSEIAPDENGRRQGTMKRWAMVGGALLVIGAGWFSATRAGGEAGSEAAVQPAATAKPVRATDAEPTVTPPPPMEDVEIPPIPEVDKNPFQPGPPPVRSKRPDVIEEGKRLFDREGRLEMDPVGRSIFVFDSGEKPMRLLENSWREYLETLTDHARQKARWRISGVVTVYEGENFLLLTKVVRIMPEEEKL